MWYVIVVINLLKVLKEVFGYFGLKEKRWIYNVRVWWRKNFENVF